MKLFVRLAGVLACAIVCANAFGQAPLMPYQEYGKRIQSAQTVAPLTSELFGESISLYNGSTEFSVTDIDLPGNSALPVRLARRFKVESKKDIEVFGGFGSWDLDVPYIHGTFADYWGPVAGGGRCTQFSRPLGNGIFEAQDFWSGSRLYIPGEGDQEILRLGGVSKMPLPTDGHSYALGTKSFHRIRCKSSTANGFAGEAFIVVDANGTTFTFDIGLTRSAGVMEKQASKWGNDQITRTAVYLAVSRIEDRFGNWVSYQWSGNQLLSITANDGRSIALTWVGRHIVAASSAGRTWNYEYAGSTSTYSAGPGNPLTKVVLPDASAWEYSASGAPWAQYPSTDFATATDNRCLEPFEGYGAFVMNAKHPSGATGLFEFQLTRHRRSGIPQSACHAYVTYPVVEEPLYQMAIPDFFDVFSLQTKTIGGPGVTPQQWTYGYELIANGRTELQVGPGAPCSNCQDVKSVMVDQPDGTIQEHRFGTLWQGNDGRLLGTYTRENDGRVVRAQNSTYLLTSEALGMPFPEVYGWSLSSDDDVAVQVRPVKTTVVAQDGAIAGPHYFGMAPPAPPSGPAAPTFTRTTNSFDVLARPASVATSNSLGHSKTDVTVYHDNFTKWVLGQVATFTTNGIQVSRTDYDANALPWKTYGFGKPHHTLTYDLALGPLAGTLRTVTDGRNNTVTLSNWKRGIPRTIAYPDGTSQSAVVNDRGDIDAVTDQVGFTTSYTYDLMGRLASITYPAGDSTAWQATTLSFQPVGAVEYGIPAGHWKHTISSGNARKVTYFDGLWRPVVEEAFDAADQSGTLSQTVKRYDASGRQIYQSYPLRGLSGYTVPTQGSRTSYDALGRVTRIEQDSELGVLAATTEYLPGLQTLSTNPRGRQTTTTYMAYDQPSTQWPLSIAHPGGSYTDIVRDPFGKPKSLTRRNADHSVSLTRHWLYDGYQQLCKTIEPETDTTILDYDAAGNLAWSASGLTLRSITDCNTQDVPIGLKVLRAYDTRNRLTSLLFPDGNGSQGWVYTEDGLPSQITTQNDTGATTAINRYSYNMRRLMTGESLEQPGLYTWSLGIGYDGNGNVASHTAPGLSVNYAPNALGQPTQAGSYASGVSYFPNGAMSQFTYGNGIVHTLTRNVRGLPERSRDAYGAAAVLDDSYDYDANGNVLAISDGLAGNRGNRDMSYDDLDRLVSTASPMFSPASYSYDVLDNLKNVKIAGRDHTYEYDSFWRLTNVTDNVDGATVIGLGYDVRGNLANKNGQNFNFDYGNRLREATGKESYRYDGHGRRIQALHPTLGNIYSMYGSDGVLRYQQDYRKQQVSNYVYLNGSLVARVANAAVLTLVPALTAPATSGSGSYTVSWSSAAGASRYRLEESVNSGAWTQIADTPGLSWSSSGKPNGSYRYRARSCHMDCSAYSSIATVAVDLVPTGVPTLTAPSYNSAGSYMVSWTSVSLATRYELQEQVNAGVWSLIQNTSATSRAISGKSSGSYGYRVRACSTGGCAVWSATATVAVELPPAMPPSLTVPAQGLNGAYTISWGTADGATSYTLEESANGGAWIAAYDGTAQSKAYSGRTAGSYGYRIKACNPAGCSGVSATGTVQVIYPPSTAPTITAPSQSTTGGYTVSWTAVGTATSYRLEESVNGGVWTLIQNTSALSRALSGKAAGSYSYRVNACNAAGCGPLSAVVAVQVIYPPSTAPTITAPSQSTTGGYTVSWAAVGTATSYRLEESVNGGVWTLIQNTSALSRALSGKAAGSYSYRVNACNTAGCGPLSVTVAVQVIYAPSTAPTITAPSQSTTGGYTVSWTAVGTATSYRLEESVNGGAWTLIQNTSALSRALSGKAAGSYSYRANACNTAGCGPLSAVVAVQVIYPPSTAPSITAPSQSTTGGYTVNWTAVGTATSYRLEESVNGGAWTLIQNTSALSRALSGKAAGSYNYRVNACNTAGCGPLSVSVTVQVILPPASAPALSVPASSSSGSYTVSWGSVATATSYQLNERPQGGGWVLIQDAAGTSRAISGKGNGTYEYQVRACNVAGCGPYSTTHAITVQMPPPPVPTGLVAQNTGWSCEISWNASSGAGHYRLLDAYGGEYESGSGTTFFWDAQCAPSYQVQACSANGCSAWSAPVGSY